MIDVEHKTQIVIIREGQVHRRISIPGDKTELVLGRRHGAWVPDVDLGDDSHMSRKHCRVFLSKGKWEIENLSRYGTFVGGRKLSTPEELQPCIPTRTGNTTWALVPSDWLFLHHGDILISAAFLRTVNYALCHCGLPVVKGISVRNIGPTLRGLLLSVFNPGL